MIELSSMNEKIDTFIQRCHDLDYVILPEARTLFFDMSTGAQKSLIDILAEAISKYTENRENERLKQVTAEMCFLWINKAFICGVVREGDGLARKLKEANEKALLLQKDMEKLSADYLSLKKQYEDAIVGNYVLPNREEEGNEPST